MHSQAGLSCSVLGCSLDLLRAPILLGVMGLGIVFGLYGYTKWILLWPKLKRWSRYSRSMYAYHLNSLECESGMVVLSSRHHRAVDGFLLRFGRS